MFASYSEGAPRQLGGNLGRCSNHLRWLLLISNCSYFTLRLSWSFQTSTETSIDQWMENLFKWALSSHNGPVQTWRKQIDHWSNKLTSASYFKRGMVLFLAQRGMKAQTQFVLILNTWWATSFAATNNPLKMQRNVWKRLVLRGFENGQFCSVTSLKKD